MDEKKSRHTARRHHAQARLAVRLHQHADDGGQLWLPNFDMNEQVKMNKHIPENLASFKDDISKQKHWMQPVSEEECEQHAGFMAYTRLDPEVGFMRKARSTLLLPTVASAVEYVQTTAMPTEAYISSSKEATLVRLFQTVNKISKQRIKTK